MNYCFYCSEPCCQEFCDDICYLEYQSEMNGWQSEVSENIPEGHEVEDYDAGGL